MRCLLMITVLLYQGIYEKNLTASSKAREHALLKQDRPAFVTILTIGLYNCGYCIELIGGCLCWNLL